jgi:hypothetical protein
MPTLTLLTTLQSANKFKCKYKMKQIKLSWKDIQLKNILKIKSKPRNNLDLLYIKEVLFQVIQLELLILKELTLKHAAEHMLIIHQKLDGLKLSSLLESAMVF